MKKVEAYMFGGVNAVGKTHVFSELVGKRPEIQPVHTAGLLMEWLGIRPGDYDTLRSLPTDYKNQQTTHAVREQVAQAESGAVLFFDYHYLDLLDGELKPTVEGDWLSSVDGLILVEATPQAVHRRVQSEMRDRRLFPKCADLTQADEEALLATFIQETRSEFRRQVAMQGTPGTVVSNEASDLAVAVGSILSFHGAVYTASSPTVLS